MKRIFKHLIFTLAFAVMFIGIAEARSAKALMDSLDLSAFNAEQKEMIEEEVASYTSEIDHLYETNKDEYKSKITELLLKLRDGFRVYNLTAKNESLQETINKFEEKSNIKVYVVSYVEGAFLNNLFQRLAELRYTFKKGGSVELKYKFTKSTQNIEEGKYKGTCERKLDSLLSEAIRNKINIPSTSFVSLKEEVDILAQTSNEVVDEAARKLLDEFEDFLCQTCLPDHGSGTQALNYAALVAQQNNPDPLLNYHIVEIPVTWTKNGTIVNGGSDNVLDCIYSFVNNFFPLSRSSFDEQYSSKFTGWHWQHTSDKKLIAGEKQTIRIQYGYARKVIANLGEQNKLDAFDEMIYQLSFIKGKKYVEEFVKKHESNFGTSLDEILRIAYLISTIDEVTWRKLQERHGSDLYLFTPESFAEYFKSLHDGLKNPTFPLLLEAIMKCEKPGREEGQMTFLVRQVQDIEYELLKEDHRIHILQVMSLGDMEEGESIKKLGEEEITLKIFNTCPKDQSKLLLEGLLKASSESNKKPIIVNIDKKINDAFGADNYTAMMESIKKMINESSDFPMMADKMLQPDNYEKRLANWRIEKAINKEVAEQNLGAIRVSDIQFNESTGEISYQLSKLIKVKRFANCDDRYTTYPCKYDYGFEDFGERITVSPFELVFFINYENLEVLNEESHAVTGVVTAVPAYFLWYLQQEKDLQDAIRTTSLVIDLATIASGPGLYLKAVTSARRCWIAFELANAFGNLAINTNTITSPEFKTVVQLSDGLMLMIGVKQIIKQGSKLNIGDALVYIIKNTPEATTGLKERIKTVIEAFRQNQRAMYTYGMVNPDAMKVYDALDKMVYDLGKKAKELWNGDWDKLNNTMIAFEERLNKLSSTERQLLEANLRESPDFFKYLSQSENPIKIIDLWSTKIKTPYGNAIQDFSEDAIKIREEVLSGAKLYKIGTTGQSYIGESQFWSTVNPLDNLEEYAKINGIPIENLINNNFITIAKIKENVPVITRKAPPAPDNPPGWGGGVEVVVDPNSVVIESFHLVSDLKKFNK